ncbi:MAG: cell division protein FtsA [Alphaproteobacteria bacterium]
MAFDYDKKSVVGFLDIGTSKVICMIGAISSDGGTVCLGVGSSVNGGFSNGKITDMVKLSFAIDEAVAIAEKKAKCHISEVVVSLSGFEFKSYFLESKVAFNFEQLISVKDIERCAKKIPVMKNIDVENYSVIHIIPIKYIIDGKKEVANPLNLSATSLKIMYHIIAVDSLMMMEVIEAVKKSHLKVKDVVANSYASGLGCLVDDDKRVGSMIVDIGKSAVSVGIFFENNFIYTFSLPLGGDYITNYICRKTNIKFDEAERIKIKYGAVEPLPIDYSEYVNVAVISDNGEEENVEMVKADILNITYPVVKMLFNVIKKYIEDKNFSHFVNRVIITGGGAKIENIKGICEDVFSLPVRVATPLKINGVDEEFLNSSYSTLFGLFVFNFQKSSSAVRFNSDVKIDKDVGIWGKIRKFINDNF